MRRLVAAVLALALGAPGVLADPETSRTLYQAGKRKYQLGDYDRAIELFKQAYEEQPAPAYIYNIAQAYRLKGDCPHALRRYREFLAAKPGGALRGRVQGYITQLEAKCKAPAASKGEPPSGSEAAKSGEPGEPAESKAAPSSTDAGAAPEAGGQTEDGGVRVADAGSDASSGGAAGQIEKPATAPSGPRFFAASAEGGVALFNLGDVVVPASPTLRLFAGYPLSLGPISLEPGVGVELSTMAYDDTAGNSTARFATLVVGAQARMAVIDRLSVGIDGGVGLLRFSGLEEGNPFTEGGVARDGAASSLAVRAGLSAEYDVGMGLAAALTPGFVWASRTDDLREPISSITRLELLAGVRYRR